MASGSADASSYRGRLGATRCETLHVTCTCGAIVAAKVYLSVNAEESPELARRLSAADEKGPFQSASCPHHEGEVPIFVPVVYHDPRAKQFALVLPEAMRHRELEERARLFDALAAEPEVEIPAYVRDPAVVFGAAGLADWLTREADARAPAAEAPPPGAADALGERGRELDERERELDSRDAALDGREVELERQAQVLAERERALREREHALRDREAALGARERAQEEIGTAVTETPAEPEAPSRFAEPAEPEKATSGGRGARLFVEAKTEELEAHELPDGGRARETSSGHVTSDDEPDDDEADFGHATIADMPPGLLGGADDDSLPDSLFESADPERADFDEALDSGELIVDDEDAIAGDDRSADGQTVVGGRHDVAFERWIASGDEMLKRIDDRGVVHLAAAVEGSALSELVAEDLQLRVLLHRLPSYPIVSIALGSQAAMEGERGDVEPHPFLFNVEDPEDAAVLSALGRRFHFELSVYGTAYEPVKKRTVTAGLAENVRYAVSTAQGELGRIDPAERSYTRAVIAFSDPGYDRFGREHPQRGVFRDEDLSDLESLAGVVQAVATARHFSRPEHEDYLLLVRGYPLKLWHEQRRRIIQRAIECGIWMGPSLARMAVREGMVESRKQLISELQRNFSSLASDPEGAPVGEQCVRDNWEALRREASALGLAGGDVLTSAPRSAPILSSSAQPLVSGTIASSASRASSRSRPARPDPGARPEDLDAPELVALLEDDEGRRVPAALELARRREINAVGAVFASLLRMTRKEAVEVLGNAVGFGAAAVPYLVEGLSARKAFLRQGCALALGVLGTEEAVEALSDAVVAEPTDVWTEIARALGEVGAPAVMSVVSRLRDRPEEARPRVAWALAHIAAQGARQPVETLAKGRDPVAVGVAQSALDLAEQAREDDAAVRGDATPRDQTVNRAFSRKFFQTAAASVEISAPALPLDESDLIEARDVNDL